MISKYGNKTSKKTAMQLMKNYTPVRFFPSTKILNHAATQQFLNLVNREMTSEIKAFPALPIIMVRQISSFLLRITG